MNSIRNLRCLSGVAILVLLVFASGCTDDGSSSSGGDQGIGLHELSSPVKGTHPILDLSPGQIRLPFPTRYLTEPDASTDTGDRVTVSKDLPMEAAAALAATGEVDYEPAITELDGFSVLGPVLIPFSGSLDIVGWNKESLGEIQEPGTGLARLYDITDTQNIEAVGLWLSFIEGQNVLVLQPARPLRAGHRILACLVGPFEDKNGKPVVRPDLFDSVMQRQEGLPEDHLIQDLEEVRDLLESDASPVDAGHVVLAFSYWTNSRIDEVHAIREAVDELNAGSPILPEEVAYQSPRVVTGKIRTPDFRIDGMIPVIPIGQDAEIQGENYIDFLLRLPVDTSEPLHPLISLHGLDGSRWSSPSYEGFVVFSIDAVLHGDRREQEAKSPYPFLDLEHPRVMRDNIRQTAADHFALARMIANIAEEPEAHGLPENLFSSEYVSMAGGSLGCINGSFATAGDPRIDNLVCMGGGGMVSAFLSQSVYGFFMPAGIRGLPPFERLLFWHFAQAVLDPCDPAAVARWLVMEPPDGRSPRNVLVTLALGDRAVPNKGTESIAWGAGLGIAAGAEHNLFGLTEWDLPVEGNIDIDGSIATGLLYEYNFDYLSPSMRHGHLFGYSGMTTQLLVFLQNAVDTGIGRIIDPEAP